VDKHAGYDFKLWRGKLIKVAASSRVRLEPPPPLERWMISFSVVMMKGHESSSFRECACNRIKRLLRPPRSLLERRATKTRGVLVVVVVVAVVVVVVDDDDQNRSRRKTKRTETILLLTNEWEKKMMMKREKRRKKREQKKGRKTAIFQTLNLETEDTTLNKKACVRNWKIPKSLSVIRRHFNKAIIIIVFVAAFCRHEWYHHTDDDDTNGGG